MHSFDELSTDNKKVIGGNNYEKFFQQSYRTPTREKRKSCSNKSLALQQNRKSRYFKYDLALIVKTAIIISICGVLVKPCYSQLDIGR